MPPPSPAPGCASGDVCTLSIATRCIAPTILPVPWTEEFSCAPFAARVGRSAQLRGHRGVDAVDHREELATLIGDLTLEGPQAGDRLLELGVAEHGEVGEHAVEALQRRRPLGVLLGCHLQRQPARRRVPTRAGVGEDLRESGDEVLQRAATGAALDLGLEDVDAGLREAPYVRDLGLELDALGVLGAQLLDA